MKILKTFIIIQHFRLVDCIINEKSFGGVQMSFSALRTDEEITRIYNKYVDMVYKICFMMFKNEAETEDATQNVFIKLIKHIDHLQSEEHIKAWLIVTSENECKNMLKYWFRSRRVDIESVPEATYESEYEGNDTYEKVMSLEKKYRLPIYLYYYEGYSTSEISQILNIKHSTLRTHLSVGRKKLKLMLEEVGNE